MNDLGVGEFVARRRSAHGGPFRPRGGVSTPLLEICVDHMLCCAAPRRKSIEFVVKSHLTRLATARGLTTAKLARLAGVNRSTVSALARDMATRVDLTSLERICVVLGCGLGDLLEIVGDDNQPDAARHLARGAT